jgi:hypothetical protein
VTSKFPSEIKSCAKDAATRLGKALDFLEWPNGEKDAPCHEINALINLQVALSKLDPEYHFYSEGVIADRGRVDLIASNGNISLAIEAKSFGKINERSESVRRDVERLHKYTPAYFRGNTDSKINEWWEKSTSRWGLILITSFRGDEVSDAWMSEDTRSAAKIMEKYPRKADRPTVDGSGFIALHSLPWSDRFAYPISLTERWSSTGKGWLLGGAVSLPPVPAAI